MTLQSHIRQQFGANYLPNCNVLVTSNVGKIRFFDKSIHMRLYELCVDYEINVIYCLFCVSFPFSLCLCVFV